jgi:hypothetical protein
MKKIGIVLAALVIATFMVGTVAAMPPIIPPDQEQYFTEKSCVQGSGIFSIEKSIVDKAVAIDVYELIAGEGNFAMTSEERLNESAVDPTDEANYQHTKMIQFDIIGFPEGGMMGTEMYSSPSFHKGTGASVTEFFAVEEMQKCEKVSIFTTAEIGQRQVLDFDTSDVIEGMWGTSAEWKKVCKKDIVLEQMFDGGFAIQKRLIFEEEVIDVEPDC